MIHVEIKNNMADYDDESDEILEEPEKEDDLYSEEIRVANVLLYGSSMAKQEIIIKLITLGNVDILTKILNALTDKEYDRVMPSA